MKATSTKLTFAAFNQDFAFFKIILLFVQNIVDFFGITWVLLGPRLIHLLKSWVANAAFKVSTSADCLAGWRGWELISSQLMFMSVVQTPKAVNPLAMFYGNWDPT